jgi:hypothetical protein
MSPAARPTITLPAGQVQAEDQAAHDLRHQASEQTPASAPDDQVVQVPAATWRRAVELMEAVERGEYRPAAEIETAIARVERLAEMLRAIPQLPAAIDFRQDAAGDARVAALRAWKPAPT